MQLLPCSRICVTTIMEHQTCLAHVNTPLVSQRNHLMRVLIHQICGWKVLLIQLEKYTLIFLWAINIYFSDAWHCSRMESGSQLTLQPEAVSTSLTLILSLILKRLAAQSTSHNPQLGSLLSGQVTEKLVLRMAPLTVMFSFRTLNAKGYGKCTIFIWILTGWFSIHVPITLLENE